MSTDIGQTFISSINLSLLAVANFVPKFVIGGLVLLIGIILASILKQLILEVFKTLKFESFLRKYGVPEAKDEFNWSNLLAEVVRWFVIIFTLSITAIVWGLPQVITILNTLLLYLPNVFISVIIALVGFVFARLAYDIILASTRSISPETAKTIASVARWAIIVFVILAVLNQLGVASDLVRILFTGFVAMIAIAGGIAFGLGGQKAAQETIDSIRKKLKQ
jgi:hypothetical protein